MHSTYFIYSYMTLENKLNANMSYFCLFSLTVVIDVVWMKSQLNFDACSVYMLVD